MTTQDELERSVERLNRAVERLTRAAARASGVRAFVDEGDLDLLLSERAELLAAVEKMRGALMAAQSFIADGGLAETDPGASIYRQVTAALTTGEEK